MTFEAFMVLASGLLYWAGVGVQSIRVRRRIGRWPNLKPRGLRERMLWLGWMFVIGVWIIQPCVLGPLRRISPLLAPWPPLSGAVATAAGLAMMILGQMATYWAYASLAYSWRIGVKKGEKTDLITAGPYATMRHPIYSYQILILLGAVLLLPTILSVIVLVVHVICCYIKARDEEGYLRGVHGQLYADYMARTGRFLPRAPQK
jgi:protein-S-isoprenylcysteine O-methyltransferase Ste14